MDEWPDVIRDERELDEVLSRPSPKLVEFLRGLDGDLMVLGAGGKVGPTLTRMARRAVVAAGAAKEVFAVGRRPLEALGGEGIRTIQCDLLDLAAVERLPRARNIIFMAGRKFGSTGDEPTTWAHNCLLPYHVARTFTGSRIASFSTGAVYPAVAVASGGATEETPPEPIGEYAMSCLGRERLFDYFSRTAGERVVHLRLNYAVELRYGVPVDIATKVWNGEPIDLAVGYANVIWQGDSCDHAIRSLAVASSPASVLNITGPGMISIRQTAETFGRIFGRKPVLTGRETDQACLSSAARSHALFGPPAVPVERMIQWIAHWVRAGGRNLGKPTHFEVRDGKF
jgi:dTDP-4-dehydrorhamnose reductase